MLCSFNVSELVANVICRHLWIDTLNKETSALQCSVFHPINHSLKSIQSPLPWWHFFVTSVFMPIQLDFFYDTRLCPSKISVRCKALWKELCVTIYLHSIFFISRRFFFLQKIGQKTYVLVCFLLQGSEQFRMGFSVRSLYLVFISCYKLQMYALNISLNKMMNGMCRIWPWLRRKTSKV